MKSLSCVRLLAIPWTAACQAPPSMGFSRQEYWSGFLPYENPQNPYKMEEAGIKNTSQSIFYFFFLKYCLTFKRCLVWQFLWNWAGETWLLVCLLVGPFPDIVLIDATFSCWFHLLSALPDERAWSLLAWILGLFFLLQPIFTAKDSSFDNFHSQILSLMLPW